MRSLLFQNLKITLPTAFAFAVLAWVSSVPACYLLDGEAASFRFQRSNIVRAIETERLLNLNKLQIRMTLGSALLGVVVHKLQLFFMPLKTKKRLLRIE
jgi:hypothetical protein